MAFKDKTGKPRLWLSEPLTRRCVLLDADGASLAEHTYQQRKTAFHKCVHDSDLRGKLMVRLDLRVHLFPAKQLVIFSRDQHKLLSLEGELYVDIVALLLKEACTGEQIITQLAGKHEALTTRTALYRLVSFDVLNSAEHNLNAPQAFYWSCLHLSPALAAERLAACPVHLASLLDRPFPSVWQEQLQRCGWQVVADEDDAELVLYLTDSYGRAELNALNAQRQQDGKQWALVLCDNTIFMFGPVFAPQAEFKNRPCWQCLNYRMQQGSQARAAEMSKMPDVKVRDYGDNVFAPQLISNHLLASLGAWLVHAKTAALSGHLVSMSAPYENAEYHWVKQLPQCRVCGDYNAPTADSKPVVPKLQTRKEMQFTSGGLRQVQPQDIVARYRHYVSPLTGVIEAMQLIRSGFSDTSGASRDWYFATYTGDNSALQQKYLKELKGGVRLASGGKGDSAMQAQASGICEAIERHCAVYRGSEEITYRAAYDDFAAGEAIQPNAIALYSESQYAQRKTINAGKAYRVPQVFDPTLVVDWTPMWSFTQQRHKYVMTSQLYFMLDLDADKCMAFSDSNGCAAGSCVEDAVLQGLCELVERDAIAIWWYNRIRMPGVDLQSFASPYLHNAEKFYRATLHRSLWLLDLTHDLGVPAFVALSGSLDASGNQRFISGAGASLNPQIAAMRAVSELNQSLLFVFIDQDEHLPAYHQEISAWLRSPPDQRDDTYNYLLPRPDAPSSKQCDYPSPCEAGTEIAYLRQKIEAQGMELLFLNQTRPDIGLPVVKLLVPGLRHFWCRLAQGRLYDVPVAQGWRAAKISEAHTNPITSFW